MVFLFTVLIRKVCENLNKMKTNVLYPVRKAPLALLDLKYLTGSRSTG